MANRYYNNQAFTLEPAIVKLFAKVTFGAAGAPTLSTADSKGIVSVTRNSQGLFTFVFGTQTGMLDVYYKLKDAYVIFNTVGTGAVPAAPLYYISADSVATAGTCSLQLTFTDKAQAGVTDPASGEVGLFEFTFKNSNAP